MRLVKRDEKIEHSFAIVKTTDCSVYSRKRLLALSESWYVFSYLEAAPPAISALK
jgi:hypothetical protein